MAFVRIRLTAHVFHFDQIVVNAVRTEIVALIVGAEPGIVDRLGVPNAFAPTVENAHVAFTNAQHLWKPNIV